MERVIVYREQIIYLAFLLKATFQPANNVILLTPKELLDYTSLITNVARTKDISIEVVNGAPYVNLPNPKQRASYEQKTANLNYKRLPDGTLYCDNRLEGLAAKAYTGLPGQLLPFTKPAGFENSLNIRNKRAAEEDNAMDNLQPGETE